MPAPQDPSRPLPVCSGKLETGSNEQQGTSQATELAFVLHEINEKTHQFFSAGCYSVLDVALNPAVLQESKQVKAEINQVYVLAVSFAQQQHGIRLSERYTVVKCSPKSSPDELHRRLGFQKWPSTFKQPDTGREICHLP